MGRAVGATVVTGDRDGTPALGAGVGTPAVGLAVAMAVAVAAAVEVGDAPGEAVGAVACWQPMTMPAKRSVPKARVVTDVAPCCLDN